VSIESSTINLPQFQGDYRASGLLLHVTSLPSRHGIGDLGPGALAWINLLQEAGQTWWQALPLGLTGYGDSPYQSLSSFAGNGLLISPGWLIEDGLLKSADCEDVLAQFAAEDIDVDALAAQLQDDGAKSIGKSWNGLMAVITSKGAAISRSM
jgi:4-alpha-glucanotransferase